MPPKFQRNTLVNIHGVGERAEVGETDALFGLSGTLPRLIEADVDRILGNPEQPRTVFDEADLAGLADSIRRVGLQQPILVREGPEKGVYVLVAGERRLRAHHILGRKTIPAIITQGRPEEVALIENVQRVDLDAVDLARGVVRLMERHGYSQAAAASLMGCTEAEVSRRLSVLRLPNDILDEYRERAGYFSRSVLIEIATLVEADEQRALWKKACQGLTIRALRVEKKRKATEEGEGRPRLRPPSLKVVTQNLNRMGDEVERLVEIRRQLWPEHREKLLALRRQIDALLEA
ncbi:MAG: ParB/RepB/Spo0J family partition protein [Rhodospirillaceae bacterium]